MLAAGTARYVHPPVESCYLHLMCQRLPKKKKSLSHNKTLDLWIHFSTCAFYPRNQELSQDSFSSQSSAPPSNQPMTSNKSSQEDSMQGRPSSLPVSTPSPPPHLLHLSDLALAWVSSSSLRGHQAPPLFALLIYFL